MSSLTDYYPFGLAMGGRIYQDTTEYRYGFGGQESVINNRNIDYGARLYNPKIGKWFSTDPLKSKYPFLSPYSFVANNPILNKELDGRDWSISTITDKKWQYHYQNYFRSCCS
ncbi:RHS repeat-associated core domain-containing protein [Litoribacter populi]|uniref:RHS repeat-associated core domain-containing protein n=1 Tax=Litoribacter populi TaxID=2598460 RepID=UPI00117FA42D